MTSKNTEFQKIIEHYETSQNFSTGNCSTLTDTQFFWFCVLNSGSKATTVFEKCKQLNPNDIKKEYLTRYMSVENAKKIQQTIIDKYKCKPENIWKEKPTSFEVIKRFMEFPRVGQKIASMAVNILQRDRGVEFADKICIDISTDVLVLRVFDRVFSLSENAYLIQLKAREICPEFPGSLDLNTWHLGQDYCHKTNPDCNNCPCAKICDYYSKGGTSG
jgi:endonuclease III